MLQAALNAFKYQKEEKERVLARSIVEAATTPPNPPAHHLSMLNQAAAFRNALAGTAGLMLGLSPSPPSRNASFEPSSGKALNSAKPAVLSISRRGSSLYENHPPTPVPKIPKKRLLDPSKRIEYNQFRIIYAEYLFSVGLL
jgi:hypothetical protein